MLLAISSCKQEPSSDYLKLKKANEELRNEVDKYEAVWNEIVNNNNINAINELSFDKNITLIHAPENIEGIEAFKAYYNNYLTGFSNINLP